MWTDNVQMDTSSPLSSPPPKQSMPPSADAPFQPRTPSPDQTPVVRSPRKTPARAEATPEVNANDVPLGTIMRGRNGRFYHAYVGKNEGFQRWGPAGGRLTEELVKALKAYQGPP